METVAFYGAGMLGSSFIRAMLRRGIAVRVWNRTHERAVALEADGARAFGDAAEAARGAQRIHLCLADDASVDAVLHAAMPGIDRQAPIADHSTVLPQRVVDRAARLASAGYAFLHAPVFIGPPMALEGQGVMMASGPATAFQRLRPALEAMCSDLRYFGERADLAAIYKLMGNAMILAVVGGIRDMLRIGEARGLSRPEAYRLFDFYDPTGQIKGRGKRMAAEEYEPLWTLAMAHKDAKLMQGAAGGERLPVIDALERYMRELCDSGLGERDLAALAAAGPS